MRRQVSVIAGASGLAAIFAASTVCAIVVRHDVGDAMSVDRALAPRYDPVGRMMADGAVRGTGTVVRRRWVLTAAHVAQRASTDAWEFSLGNRLYRVGEIVPHPCWTGDLDEGHDLALVRLVDPVDEATPARLFRGDDGPGTRVSLLGYGFTDRGGDGRLEWDGVLRVATNRVDRHELDAMIMGFDAPGSGRETELEGMAAFNDSGGPALVETAAGARVAGVHSFIVDRNRNGLVDYGDEHGAVRVVPHLAWIDAVIDGCPHDLDGTAAVDFGDLAAVLAGFGSSRGRAEDLDGSGVVDLGDVLLVLAAWGPCR